MGKEKFKITRIDYSNLAYFAAQESAIKWAITNVKINQTLAHYFKDGTVSILYDFITVQDLKSISFICEDLEKQFLKVDRADLISEL